MFVMYVTMLWHKIGAECVNGSPCVNSLALNIRVYFDGWQLDQRIRPDTVVAMPGHEVRLAA